MTAFWSCLVLAFVLGLAGGFQSIYVKFGSDAPRVLTTITGWIYWLSRGAVPVVAYLGWRGVQTVSHDSFWQAALCGIGSEAVLRSRFYLGERKTAGGKVEEVVKGVFDLLNWYQVLCLKTSGNKLASERKNFIATLMAGETDFLQLCQRARSNAGAWAIEDEKQELLKLVADFEKDFRKAVVGQTGDELKGTHIAFIKELGYAAMRMVGRGSLKTFFK